MNKLRIIFLDQNTGNSISNVVVTLSVHLGVWSQDPEHPEGEKRTECRQLGVLASNHVGYLSLPIPENINNIGEILYYEASTAAGYTSDSISISPDQLDVVHPFVINKGNIQRPTLNPKLPSIPQPDILDWKLSPDSFGTSDIPIIGEDGCETLLPSNVSDRIFNFSQLIKTPNLPALIFSTSDEFNSARKSVKRGSLLNYEMSWIPINHGLGQVLYSLTLAPCESVNLAIIDWFRQDTLQRDELTSNSEAILHDQRRDRTIDEAVEAMVEEFQKGKSLLGGTAGVGGGGISGIFSVTGSHAIGIGRSQSEGERNTEASTIQNLSDRITQASNALRELRSTIVVQASQAERERIETRTVRNNNHSHSLTILYYEVVRHYCVATKLATKQDVFFVDFSSQLIDAFDETTVVANRIVLERYLLDPMLAEYFDAAERLLYNYEGVPEEVREPEVFNMTGIDVAVMTGDPGTNQDVSFRMQLADGFIWEKEIDPRGNSFEEDSLTSQRFTYVDDLPAVPPEEVQRVGIKYRTPGRNWRFSGLTVHFSDTEASSVRRLYDSSIDGSPLLPIPHLFTRDGEWWSGPIRFERVHDSFEDYSEQIAARAADRDLARQLFDHLTHNKHYYNKLIWLNEDPDARAVRLDQYFEDGRSLLDSIDNYIVGISGNYVAFPAGELVVHIPGPNSPIYPVERILSLPTRGAFAESKLSHCNASEKIDETRFWNWQESPCPADAPQISGISPGSRFQPSSGISPTVPSSSLGVEGAPEAPTPSGLSDVLALLKTPNIFRDMSGIDALGPLLGTLAEVAGKVEDRRLQENGETERERIKAEKEDSSEGGGSSESSSPSGSGTGRSGNGGSSGGSGGSGSPASPQPSAAREQLGESQVLRDTLNRGIDEGWMSEGEAGEQYRRYAQNLYSSGNEETATDATATSGTRYLPTRSGATLEQGRLLLSDFPVNGWNLTEDHIRGLNEFVHLLNNSVTYELLLIEGRASNTGPESETDVRPEGEGPGNIELSRLRANGVAQYLLGRDIINSSNYPPIRAHGSASPLILAEGEVDVNRSVMISYTYAVTLPTPDRIPVPTIPDPIVSRHWELALNLSGGAGHVISGWGASGELKNVETDEIYEVRFAVLGIGEGLASPGGAGIDDDDFVPFETYERIPAISFHRRYCRVSNASAGVAVIGGGVAFIHIPELTNEEITVYGLTMGTVGADISVGIVGIIWMQESSADRARAELREYNRRVEEYNRSIGGR